MSKSLADVYSASGHFGASLNCGEVTLMVRDPFGAHTAMSMSLHSWCEMIEQSRSKVLAADVPKGETCLQKL